MFKVPEWETDVPKPNVVFTKKAINKKSKNENVAGKSIRNVVQNFQDDTKNQNIFKPTVTASRKKKKPKKYKQKSDTTSSEMKNEDLKEPENFKMDKTLVNSKKIKLIDIYKKEDCQKLLFSGTKETRSMVSISPKNNKTTLKSDLSNGIKNNINKPPKKRKHDDTNKEINSITVNAKKNKPIDTDTVENGLSKRIIKINSSQKKKINKINMTENNGTEGNKKETVDDTSRRDILQGRKMKDVIKKEKFKKLLEQNNNRAPINTTGNKLRERMMERLKAAQFRYLNEKLYTSSGSEAQQIFQSDPAAFRTYHQGYQLQVKKWPVNPLDVIVKKFQKMPKTFVVADMGCGEAALSKRLQQKVHSFDLVSSAPDVVACDMARTPLLTSSVDVVVYCLALMGTELTQYLVEANRLLKTGGQLLIAEVESRFDDVNGFIKDVERLGFRLKTLDKEQSVFFFLHFVKANEPPVKKGKLPVLNLKPCLYKKR